MLRALNLSRVKSRIFKDPRSGSKSTRGSYPLDFPSPGATFLAYLRVEHVPPNLITVDGNKKEQKPNQERDKHEPPFNRRMPLNSRGTPDLVIEDVCRRRDIGTQT